MDEPVLISRFTLKLIRHIKTYLKNIDTNPHSNNNGNASKFIVSHLTEYHKEVVDSPFSIKIVTHGAEHYKVNNQRFKIESDSYLIVNQGDELEVNVQTANITQGICIYPPQQIIQEVYNYRIQTEEQLLNSEGNVFNPIHFTRKNNSLTHTSTGAFIKETLPSILQNNASNVTVDFHSIYTQLAEHLVHDQLGINKQLLNLKSSKKHTQEELYRRLSAAKEYIHYHYDQKLNIDQLAEVACLSKYHFLRSFRDLYQCTPYQYALHLKLEAAQKLLSKGYSYSETSIKVGFSDPKNLRKALINPRLFYF